jgi:sugar fermentation stimulation protein A
MMFETPLVRGTLLRRYNRFLADVALADGERVTAHCANSGSMLSVSAPGSEVWLAPAVKAGRKLPYSWELIRVDGTLVGINTSRPNAIAAAAITAGVIPELSGYPSLRREVPYGSGSRIDLLLEAPDRPKCFVEVKNVTLKRTPGRGGALAFPDAVTARGRKHLDELRRCVGEGARGVMLFVAQRDDGDRLTMARDIDPEYAAALSRAVDAGVDVLCYACAVSVTEIRIERRLPVDIAEAGAVP